MTKALPRSVLAHVDRARASYAKKKRAEAQRAVLQAFAAVGLSAPSGPSPVFALAAELTPEQRALIELVVREDLPGPVGWYPGGAAALRWLGVEPPGPLDTEVEVGGQRTPLWRALQAVEAQNKQLAILATLPVETRLDVLATFADQIWAYRIRPDERTAWAGVARLRGEARDWALARIREPFEPAQPLLHRLAFLALVRAGVPIEAAHDGFLPIGTNVPAAISVECARAIPLDRLEAVAPALLRACFGPRAIEVGLAIVEKLDSPAIAAVVIETSKKSLPHNRKAEMATLAAIAKRKPRVAALLSGEPVRTTRSLVVTSRTSPRAVEELTPLQARQLVAAGKRWDGKSLPVARRLSLDENDESAIGWALEHLSLSEHGEPAFEAWLYMGDSGTFFAAGTTKVIAEQIQGGIQLAKKGDQALADALAEASGKKAAKKKAAKKKAAKKKP